MLKVYVYEHFLILSVLIQYSQILITVIITLLQLLHKNLIET
jgi:hypothetical protein